jgi:hypothetical protein
MPRTASVSSPGGPDEIEPRRLRRADLIGADDVIVSQSTNCVTAGPKSNRTEEHLFRSIALQHVEHELESPMAPVSRRLLDVTTSSGGLSRPGGEGIDLLIRDHPVASRCDARHRVTSDRSSRRIFVVDHPHARPAMNLPRLPHRQRDQKYTVSANASRVAWPVPRDGLAKASIIDRRKIPPAHAAGITSSRLWWKRHRPMHLNDDGGAAEPDQRNGEISDFASDGEAYYGRAGGQQKQVAVASRDRAAPRASADQERASDAARCGVMN